MDGPARPRPSPSSQIPLTHYPVPRQVFNEPLLCARQQGKVVPEHKDLSLEERVLTRGQLVSCAGYDEGGDSPRCDPRDTGQGALPWGGRLELSGGEVRRADQSSRAVLRAEGQDVRAQRGRDRVTWGQTRSKEARPQPVLERVQRYIPEWGVYSGGRQSPGPCHLSVEVSCWHSPQPPTHPALLCKEGWACEHAALSSICHLLTTDALVGTSEVGGASERGSVLPVPPHAYRDTSSGVQTLAGTPLPWSYGSPRGPSKVGEQCAPGPCSSLSPWPGRCAELVLQQFSSAIPHSLLLQP